jgi:uncharacterized RDD family membrane protein YckC
MSTTPPDHGPPVPPGYQPGDYVPFTDRDPDNPSAIAGQWADPALQAQVHGRQGGRALTPAEQYRAIYGADAPDRVEFASWGRRVLGYLVDSLLGAVVAIPSIIGWSMLSHDVVWRTDLDGNRVIDESATHVSGAAIGMVLLGLALCLAFGIWNVVVRQGRTGYTLGKEAVGIRLVGATSGRPVGAGISFVRQLAHIVDGLVCYLGWLWPLWDRRNQTLADKMVGTIVVIQPADSAQ